MVETARNNGAIPPAFYKQFYVANDGRGVNHGSLVNKVGDENLLSSGDCVNYPFLSSFLCPLNFTEWSFTHGKYSGRVTGTFHSSSRSCGMRKTHSGVIGVNIFTDSRGAKSDVRSTIYSDRPKHSLMSESRGSESTSGLSEIFTRFSLSFSVGIPPLLSSVLK